MASARSLQGDPNVSGLVKSQLMLFEKRGFVSTTHLFRSYLTLTTVLGLGAALSTWRPQQGLSVPVGIVCHQVPPPQECSPNSQTYPKSSWVLCGNARSPAPTVSAGKGTVAAEATLPVIQKFSDLGSGDWRYNSDSDRETLRYTERSFS